MNLSKDQADALQYSKIFINSKNKLLTISGAAGTGKTWLTKHILDYLSDNYINYYLCAPTHRACLVLQQFTNEEVMTLHKLLSLSPLIDIFNLDLKDLKFKLTGKSFFPSNGILIIDEASMINDELYDLLIEKIQLSDLKIIFIGDASQLEPINDYKISKVFNNNDTIHLTTIHRQQENNLLIPLLTKLRTESVDLFYPITSPEGNLYLYDNVKLFIKDILPLFNQLLINQNINEVKLLTYTNERVKGFNNVLRKIMFNDDKLPFHKFELLTCYDNFSNTSGTFINSMDYIILSDPVKRDKQIHNFTSLPGYDLNLYDSVSKEVHSAFVLSDEIDQLYLNYLAQRIETTRLEAITAPNNTLRKNKWKTYFKMMENFTTIKPLIFDNRIIKNKTFDYGYCSTTHKSQGLSLNNVCVDMNDLRRCKDKRVLRQLQYVSLSRTKNDIYLLQ